VVTCHFCKASLPIEQAMDAGWVPSFWDVATDNGVTEPVCPECQRREGIDYNEETGNWERPAAEPSVIVGR
jgi:hypothetical protein